MDLKGFRAFVLIIMVSSVCWGLPKETDNIDNLHSPRKGGSSIEQLEELIRILFDKMDEKISNLDQKIELKTVKLEKMINKMINANMRETLDRSFKTISRAPAANIKQKRSIIDRVERETDGLHVSEVFITLYEKALETSSDVKTLLEKTDDVHESAKDCGSIPSIIEEVHSQCGSQNEAVCEKPKSCLELLKKGHTLSGVYKIHIETLEKDIEVHCDQETDGGGWIVFQRRKDGSVDFYRDWADYKIGFGNVLGEFWLGLDYLHDMTATGHHELRIDMEDFEENKRYAKYNAFKVGPESKKYVLTATGYSGDAGDSLKEHNGRRFSTKDADNDDDASKSCIQAYQGAWWYSSCHTTNLNGLYLGGAHKSYAKGINWQQWKGYYYSLKVVEMKFREIMAQ